jgi:hypothetical protein
VLHVLLNSWKVVLDSYRWFRGRAQDLRLDIALGLNIDRGLLNLLRDGVVIDYVSAILLSQSLLFIDKPIEIKLIVNLKVFGVISIALVNIFACSISELIHPFSGLPAPGPFLHDTCSFSLLLEHLLLLPLSLLFEIEYAGCWELNRRLNDLVYDLSSSLLFHGLLIVGLLALDLDVWVVLLNKVQDGVRGRLGEASDIIVAVVAVNPVAVVTDLIPELLLQWDQTVPW